MNILKINELSVIYDKTPVLQIQQPIEIDSGDIVGIIGENGAGKTTLINAILNEVNYSGNIYRGFSRDDVGVQFQSNSYNDYMKVGELVYIVTGYRCNDKKISDQLKSFDIDNLVKKKIGVLSGGERQRLTLFLLLYLKPSVLFLDELTTGLDYEKRQKMLSLIYQYSKDKTVFTVTHYFDELEGFANKMLILKHGKVAFFGTIPKLERQYPLSGVVKLSKSVLMPEMLNKIRQLDSAREDESGEIWIPFSSEEEKEELERNLKPFNIHYDIKSADLYAYYIMATKNTINKGDRDNEVN